MTKGPIVKTIIRLALPIMASSFLGTLYNLCDMAWVGTLGAKAVAGVGVGGMFIWLAGGLAALPRMGGQVLAAQAIGSEDLTLARTITRSAIQLILLLGLVFGILSFLFARTMVAFFQLTDSVSVNSGVSYIRITCGLIIFSFLNMTLTGLYTGDGDSKTPMIANLIGLVLNMILDPLLITGVGVFPRLEAVGAAAATVISQFVVTIALLIAIRTKGTQHEIFSELNLFKPCHMRVYDRVIRIGVPAAIQSMVYCFISMLLTRFVSDFGAEAIAVARVGGQIESVSWNTGDGFAAAINAFCGQNYGAREFDRIRKGYYFSVLTSFLWGMLVLVAFVFLPGPISRIFFHEPVAINVSIGYLRIIGLCEPFLIAEIVTIGALSGLGKTRLCSVISILLTGLRIPLALILQHTAVGVTGIWWAMTITTILKGLTFFSVFRYSKLK